MSALHRILALDHPVLLPGMISRVQLLLPDQVRAIELHATQSAPLLVVPTQQELREDAVPEQLADIGCVAQVDRVVQLGDGTVRVLLRGIARARLRGVPELDDDGLVANARTLRDRDGDPEKTALLATHVRQGLAQLAAASDASPPPLARIAQLDTPPGRLADLVAANLTLPRPVVLALLAEVSVERRLAQVVVLLGRELALQTISVQVEKEVQDGLDKQQRDYYLREKIRALRKELGETTSGNDQLAELEQSLRDSGMPQQSLDDALRELDRLRRMHPDAGEYTVSRTWLEWLAGMPWTHSTDDKTDLKEAAQVLDAEHHGMKRAKDRMLEHLAVRQLNPEGRGPILCLLGPPGVGKTSLGRRVAAALGREFQRVSLGGVKDESEIRGHRRTYVGALPGRIVQAMKRAGSRNPVIVLDEIDKLGKDFRGDPASALLEVLDPEQNGEFVDHYLDAPFDLSQVLFICTANDRAGIPAALDDRLEVMDVPGYTHEEKLSIARKHLLPRLRASHGLTTGQLTVTGPVISHVVQAYTREAGLRGLERELAKLHRKSARAFVEGRTRPFRVDSPAKAERWLGPRTYFAEDTSHGDTCGVSIGLAWTRSGGELLTIEAASYPAPRGGLKLTGQLGDVMKESAETALTLVRVRGVGLGIPIDALDGKMLHIHLPAGGIPKDGPSAGITLVVTIASLLSGRPVREGLAMTGEVSLTGRVLPVGGVKEKMLAARRAGVTDVILPAQNAGDLEELPANARADLRFHLVERIDDVLALAFPAT